MSDQETELVGSWDRSVVKRCSRCHELRLRVDFSPAPSRGGGLASICSPCRRKSAGPRPATKKPETLSARDRRLRRCFGISLETYEALLASQGGVCAICQQPPVSTGEYRKNLDVDHDHETGRVRGLLCNTCNSGLGFFRDDAAAMARAVDYLEG